MPTGKQEPATGLALAFARYISQEMPHRALKPVDIQRAMRRSSTYVWDRLQGDKPFNLADMESICNLFDLSPEEMWVRIRIEALRRYEGDLVPLYGMVMSSQRGMEVYQIPGTGAPIGNQADPSTLTQEEATSIGMTIIDLDDSGSDEDYDVTLTPVEELGLAAKRGTRKVDEPHAE